MKTKIFLGISAALSLAGAAHAVYLNPHGTGEALVYPYYTVNGGNSTLLSIVNTTNTGKAVKVRFLEAYDSRDVMNFNLYLSQYDVWVGQVIDRNDGAAIFTNDNSCTVPKLPTSAETAGAFFTVAFDGEVTWPQTTDGGPTDISRTREGSIEIIEMGEVTNGTHGTLQAITHQNGTPKECSQIVAAWDSYWKADSSADTASPTGGLFGSGMILNVDLGTVEAYNAEAIAQFYTPGSATTHSMPYALTPNLSSGTSKTSFVVSDDGPITTPFARSIDAVSSLFMVDRIMNEYVTSMSIGATSEWVLSYPTKRFYTDLYYVESSFPNAVPPFDRIFGVASPDACAGVHGQPFNREEAATSDGIDMGAPKPPLPTCYATQILTFGQDLHSDSRVLGSKLHTSTSFYALPFQSGWARYDFVPYTNHHLTGTNGNTFYGLPVTGFAVTQFVNDNIGGVLSNYTTLSPHKSHLSCDRGDPTKPCS